RARSSTRTPDGGCRSRRASAEATLRSWLDHHGLSGHEVARVDHHRLARLEPLHDLDAVLLAAAGDHAPLLDLALADREHLLDAREDHDGRGGHEDRRLVGG